MNFRDGSKFKPHIKRTDLNENTLSCHTLLHLINPYVQTSLGVTSGWYLPLQLR